MGELVATGPAGVGLEVVGNYKFFIELFLIGIIEEEKIILPLWGLL